VALLVSADAQTGSYVPERVFATATGVFADFEVMLADLATADVVFVGEQHDDPNTHRLELAVLEGLARRRGDLVLSLEMIERDVQESLDRFRTGQMDEAAFLAGARPWPRYATDYKPLVEFARAGNWPIVAANVPRPLASEVSKAGPAALDAKDADAKRSFAADRQCPADDEYFERFGKAMGDHPAGDAEAQRLMVSRFYEAQCLKDETMAESIARAHAEASTGGRRPLVVHVNGAFHSDFRLGTAARVERRLAAARVVVVTMMPVASLDGLAPVGDDLRRADYLVYTLSTPKK
jgi:uncharacterized iron-regulated protein